MDVLDVVVKPGALLPPGPMVRFDSGATRSTEDGKLDYEAFISPLVTKRYAEYLHSHRRQVDGQMRAGDNWQQGMPRGRYIKSLVRHVQELHLEWRTSKDQAALEESLCAAIFNCNGLLLELLKGRDV